MVEKTIFEKQANMSYGTIQMSFACASHVFSGTFKVTPDTAHIDRSKGQPACGYVVEGTVILPVVINTKRLKKVMPWLCTTSKTLSLDIASKSWIPSLTR